MIDGRAVPHTISSALEMLGVPGGATVVVACSGGCDSVAVASALHEAGWDGLHLAWINHNIRGHESVAGEARAVRDLARHLGVPLHERTVPEGTIIREAEEGIRSIEEVARSYRYDLLASIVGEVAVDAPPPTVLVTAHHRDDAAETTLMRLLTGHSLLESLTIPPTRRLATLESAVTVYRPALSVARSELRSYAVERSLAWVHDDSNDDLRFLRNRVRNGVFPVLDRYLGGTSGRLSAIGREAARIRESLWALIPDSARGAVDDDGVWTVKAEAFFRLPESARELVLREAVYRVSGLERASGGLVREALRRMGERAVRSAGVADWTISGADIDIVIGSVAIIVRRRVVPTGQSGYLWLVKGPVHLRTTSGGLRPAAETGTGRSRARDANGGWYGPLYPPTVIRSRRPGDAVSLAAGRRELSDALKRAGVPARRRDSVAIMEDTEGIAAIFDVDGVQVMRDEISVAQDRRAAGHWVYVGVVNEDEIDHAE